ncbi:MAG TPA: sugar ABC transporter ATP-binding protein [Clostridiaceae bacterium]|nr:sugar ABC transporter ATP-binding protein [Clostridiaceae bacterium]
MGNDIILEMKNICKSFPGVVALNNVSLSIKRGEVHALCGENGAGKSTLMKILYGIYRADSGEIWINGEKRNITSPVKAQENGLSIIFQEFNLVDTLSVAENIFLGRLKTTKSGKIDWKSIEKDAAELMLHIGCDIDPKTPVGSLSVSQKQMVEIAKALSYNAEIIVMDEPSATLTDREMENLYRIIQELKEKKITIIYISHKMDEIFKITDRVTVLRDGVVICTLDTCKTCREEIVSNMVGRCLGQEYPKRENYSGEKVLEVKNINRKGVLNDVSFCLHRGEVLGIAGLVGAGRTELVRAIFGADRISSGKVFVNGKEVRIKSPIDAIRNGIALLTEDRKQQGLILNNTVKENISITNLKDIVKFGLLMNSKENNIAKEYVDRLSVKTSSINQKCINLSGGNQQKVVLAKWLYSNADILILDEPTRGIDVGAKQEIYHIINELVKMGKAVIMISSEIPEVLALSDRILVMHKGRITREFKNESRNVTPEQVMNCAIG